jgi:hypothetical protein
MCIPACQCYYEDLLVDGRRVEHPCAVCALVGRQVAIGFHPHRPKSEHKVHEEDAQSVFAGVFALGAALRRRFFESSNDPELQPLLSSRTGFKPVSQ